MCEKQHSGLPLIILIMHGAQIDTLTICGTVWLFVAYCACIKGAARTLNRLVHSLVPLAV